MGLAAEGPPWPNPPKKKGKELPLPNQKQIHAKKKKDCSALLPHGRGAGDALELLLLKLPYKQVCQILDNPTAGCNKSTLSNA